MEQDCLYCKKLAAMGFDPLTPDPSPPKRRRGEQEGDVVWYFPHSVALLGPWQFYEGYCVLVSRRHATELSRLDDDVRRSYLDEMCLLARAIEDVFRPHKLNYECLGNQVPHLHWHLFPRSLADPDRLRPVWLALDEAERDAARRLQLQGSADRAAVAGALRRHLEALGAPIA